MRYIIVCTVDTITLSLECSDIKDTSPSDTTVHFIAGEKEKQTE